jgi:hypothetical protein
MVRTHKILVVAGAMVAAMLLAGLAARPVNAGPLITVQAPAWEPSQYDGAIRTSDAPDVTTLPTVHAVYVYSSDVSSRFLQFAAMFQRDARHASTMLDASVARAIRWDERDSANGRYLDVTVVKSQYTAKRLAGNQQFSLVKNDLSARGLTNPNKKYLVWLDAPSSYCGQSDLPTDSVRSPVNKAEAKTVSVVYRYYDLNGPNGGFCAPILHELAHAMGAVQPSAPHYTGGHCNDNGNDLLCIFKSAIPYDPNLGGYYYDYGNDDYWDPAADPTSGSTAKLAWWTVNLSRFICPAKLNPETAMLQADCSSANSNPGY